MRLTVRRLLLALGIVAYRALAHKRRLTQTHTAHQKFEDLVNSIEGMVLWEAHPHVMRLTLSRHEDQAEVRMVHPRSQVCVERDLLFRGLRAAGG